MEYSFSDLYFYDLDNYTTEYLGCDLSSLYQMQYFTLKGFEAIEVIFLDTCGNFHDIYTTEISVPSVYALDINAILDLSLVRNGSFLVFQYPRDHQIGYDLGYRERGYVHYQHIQSHINTVCHGNIGNVKKKMGDHTLLTTEYERQQASTFLPQRSWPADSDRVILRFHNTCAKEHTLYIQLIQESLIIEEHNATISSMGLCEVELKKKLGVPIELRYISQIPLARPLVEFFRGAESCGIFHS